MKQNPKRVTKVFINLIKLSTMRTLKLIVMAIMTLVVGCQKFEQNNTDNPKDPTEQQGSGTNNGNKTDKNDKSKDESKPKPPTFATGVVRLSPEDYAKIPKAKFPATGDENLPDECIFPMKTALVIPLLLLFIINLNTVIVKQEL